MTGAAESALARDLDRTARQFGTELPKARIEQLLRYAKLLEAWNERINLTGARDQETLVR